MELLGQMKCLHGQENGLVVKAQGLTVRESILKRITLNLLEDGFWGKWAPLPLHR